MGFRLRIIFLFLFGMAVLSEGHPHVFTDASVKVVFDQNGLTEVVNRWVYDEIYSAAMVASVDVDKDGQLSATESEALKPIVLRGLEEFNYFNYLQVGTMFLKVEKITNFKASVKNKRLVLDFGAKFTVPVATDYTMLVLVVGDPSNYVQVTADMENASVVAPGTIDVEYFADNLEGLTLFKAFRSEIDGLYMRFKKK